MDIGTTLKGENPYDQIAMKVKNGMFELRDAGMFSFENYVFRDEDHKEYYVIEGMTEPEAGLITHAKEQSYINGRKKTRKAALIRGLIAQAEQGGNELTDAEKEAIKNSDIPESDYWSDEKTREAIDKYYKSVWRSFQMSDHKPIWVELKVDFTNDYLNSLKPENNPLADFS